MIRPWHLRVQSLCFVVVKSYMQVVADLRPMWLMAVWLTANWYVWPWLFHIWQHECFPAECMTISILAAGNTSIPLHVSCSVSGQTGYNTLHSPPESICVFKIFLQKPPKCLPRENCLCLFLNLPRKKDRQTNWA